MPVAAEVVVGGDDIGLVATDEPDETAGGLVEVGLPERARIVIAGATHHVRVVVAEVLPLGDAQHAHGPFQLDGPHLPEAPVVLRGVQLGDHDLAHLAAGAGDEDDATTLGDGLRHRAAGPDGLVVGVGMDGHESGDVGGLGRRGRGFAHDGMLARSRASGVASGIA